MGSGRVCSSIVSEETAEGKLPVVSADPPSIGLVPKLFARRMRVLGLFDLRACA